MKFLPMTSELYDYLLSVSLREPAILAKIRIETSSHPRAGMQIAPDQGSFLQLLVGLLAPKKVLEVGIFTGYSSTAIALALPLEGRLTACELSEEFAEIARGYWVEAGVHDKIDLRLGPARETLDDLLKTEENSFDFAFLDADKSSYEVYYEQCLRLVRPGGLIAIDNVLWSGRVLDPNDQDEDTVALRAFNEKVFLDSRVEIATLALADGLTLARVR